VVLSQKCQYALRAMYEITLRHDDWPVKSGEIAAAQSIPPTLSGEHTRAAQARRVH